MCLEQHEITLGNFMWPVAAAPGPAKVDMGQCDDHRDGIIVGVFEQNFLERLDAFERGIGTIADASSAA